jgi:hypothetical protein
MNGDLTTAANRPPRPAPGIAVLVLIVAGAACLAMPAAAGRRLPDRAALPVPDQLARASA